MNREAENTNETGEVEELLIQSAIRARESAYCPYSGYAVGAAVLTELGGKVFTGCNVENASYGLTNCAERTAIFRAVSEGMKEIYGVAIAAKGSMPYPCGACRQVMAEFAGNGSIPVYVVRISDRGEIEEKERHTLEELFPYGFRLE